MTGSWGKVEYLQLAETLGCNEAAIKLMLLSSGINTDGLALEKSIPDYRKKYRLKRAKKKIMLQKGMLIDAETHDIPFVPEEIFLSFAYFKSVVKFNYRPQSPFLLKCSDKGLYIENIPADIYVPVELSEKCHETLADGTEINKIMPVLGSDRVAILGYEGCSGWFSGKQCKFCDSCAARPDEVRVIPSMNDLNTKFNGDIDAWFNQVEEPYFARLEEAYQILLQRKTDPHFHLHAMAGNLGDVNAEWHYMLRLTRRLNQIRPVEQLDSYLNLLPPSNFDLLEEARLAGYQKLLFSLEVFGESYFRSICPEKYELVGFNRFIDAMKLSVEIFGKGQVRCNFVLGAQPVETLKEGVEFLAGLGIPSDFTIFTPKAGTPWENKAPPEFSDVVDFTLFLFKVYEKHGFSGLYCSQSSRSCVLNEMLMARQK